MNVLVVDDEPINREVLAAALRQQGHAVVMAGDGVEALAVLGQQRVDAVIADVLMPRMDGYRLCHELRRDPARRQLPFIFYTGTFTTPEDERLCFDVGGDRLLRKPASPEDVAAALEDAQAHAAGGRPAARAPDRGAVLHEYSERLVRKLETKNQELLAIIGRLRHSERELARKAQQLRLIVEHSPGAIAMLDRDMRYVVTSRRWLVDYRLGDRDLTGLSHYEVFPDLPERWREVHRRCLAGATERGDEEAFPRADGGVDWVRWEVLPWHDDTGGVGGLIIFSEVITERKQAEAALRASEEHFRALFEEAADGLALASPDLVCRNANARCGQLLGRAPGELVGMNLASLVAEPERPLVALELAQPVARRPYRKEWQIARSNGATFTAELTAARLSDGQLLLTLRDVSDRRRAEDALRESERRFTDMLRNLELIALMLDRKGHVIYCNDYLLRVTGWQRPDVLGKDWFAAFVPPEDRATRETFRDLLVDKPSAWHHENELVTSDGGRRLIHWSNTVLRSGSGEVIGTASIGEDITERRQAEDDRLRRAAELEKFHRFSVGRELRMIELKREVNGLARRVGQPEPYDLTFAEKP